MQIKQQIDYIKILNKVTKPIKTHNKLTKRTLVFLKRKIMNFLNLYMIVRKNYKKQKKQQETIIN